MFNYVLWNQTHTEILLCEDNTGCICLFLKTVFQGKTWNATKLITSIADRNYRKYNLKYYF